MDTIRDRTGVALTLRAAMSSKSKCPNFSEYTHTGKGLGSGSRTSQRHFQGMFHKPTRRRGAASRRLDGERHVLIVQNVIQVVVVGMVAEEERTPESRGIELERIKVTIRIIGPHVFGAPQEQIREAASQSGQTRSMSIKHQVLSWATPRHQ